MPRIYPFRALRYDLAQAAARDVVTQPSEKITPAMQQAYYQRSPYNLARIIQRLPELFDEDGTVYANAARDFAAWRAAGILAQERESCIFAYSQRFAVPGHPGVAKERQGFIALGDLCDYGQSVIFRHEETAAKAKLDRLSLLRATRANFGQIFMLYSDPARTAEQLLFGNGDGTLPEIEVTDEYGVLHRVWKVSDPAKINLLTSLLADKKLIIADGQDRYEAALDYARERVPAKPPESCERMNPGPQQPAYPEAAAMMTFVNMESDGMVLLAAHRVVSRVAGLPPARLLEGASPYFEIEELAQGDTAAALGRLGGIVGAGFVAVTTQGWFLLTARPSAADPLREIPARLRQIDVVLLHSLVLEKLLGFRPEPIEEEKRLRYVRDAAEAADQVARGEADIAFLIKPVSLDQLREVAFAGEVLPRNSTDFYPKLLTGLALYALD
jgi:uncharacterized protein (DUF1015 family)